MASLAKFIHFGCWNYDKCGGNNPVTAVTRAVTEETERREIEYVIVAGDNYYPIKNKRQANGKLKLINPSMLASGFDCLPNIETYVLFGNHDLDNSKSLRLYPRDGTIQEMEDSMDELPSLKENCVIMDMELAAVQGRPNMKLPPPDFVTSRITGNTIVLMIDTTMYDMESITDEAGHETDKDGNLICYDKYYGVSGRNALIERQNGRIREILSALEDHVTNIILVGHHPLLYPKVKKNDEGKLKLKIPYLKDLASFLLEIHDPTRKYFYLCADYHNYQQGTVILRDMHIEQYIVGTGGTRLDDPLEAFLPKRDGGYPIQEVVEAINPKTMIPSEDGSRYLLKDEINTYGYLRVTLDETPRFEFVKVVPTGGRRTRRKRARKRTRKR